MGSYAHRRRQPLGLTASDELLAMENIEVLRQNGFEIEIDEAAASQGSRLHLATKPTSGSTDFDMKERSAFFDEILTHTSSFDIDPNSYLIF